MSDAERRARTTDRALHELHGEVRHDQHRGRALCRGTEHAAGTEWKRRGRDAAPNATHMRKHGPEALRAAMAFVEDRQAREQLAIARVQSGNQGGGCHSYATAGCGASRRSNASRNTRPSNHAGTSRPSAYRMVAGTSSSV